MHRFLLLLSRCTAGKASIFSAWAAVAFPALRFIPSSLFRPCFNLSAAASCLLQSFFLSFFLQKPVSWSRPWLTMVTAAFFSPLDAGFGFDDKSRRAVRRRDKEALVQRESAVWFVVKWKNQCCCSEETSRATNKNKKGVVTKVKHNATDTPQLFAYGDEKKKKAVCGAAATTGSTCRSPTTSTVGRLLLHRRAQPLTM